MKVLTLLKELTQCGIDSGIIYTGDGNPEDRYALVFTDPNWHVFYTERGQQFERRHFLNEEDACKYLWTLLCKDYTISPSSPAGS